MSYSTHTYIYIEYVRDSVQALSPDMVSMVEYIVALTALCTQPRAFRPDSSLVRALNIFTDVQNTHLLGSSCRFAAFFIAAFVSEFSIVPAVGTTVYVTQVQR